MLTSVAPGGEIYFKLFARLKGLPFLRLVLLGEVFDQPYAADKAEPGDQ